MVTGSQETGGCRFVVLLSFSGLAELDHVSFTFAAPACAVSLDNVRNYVRAVYEKLQVHSRTEAVVTYLRAEQL